MEEPVPSTRTPVPLKQSVEAVTDDRGGVKCRCICNWDDCQQLHQRIVEHFRIVEGEDSDAAVPHPWSATFCMFRMTATSGFKLRAIQYCITHHFQLDDQSRMLKVFYVAPHHFPIALLKGKSGNRTTLLTKSEAKSFEGIEGHSRLSEDCNRLGTILKHLGPPESAPIAPGKKLAMFVQSPVSSHREVTQFVKSLKSSRKDRVSLRAVLAGSPNRSFYDFDSPQFPTPAEVARQATESNTHPPLALAQAGMSDTSSAVHQMTMNEVSTPGPIFSPVQQELRTSSVDSPQQFPTPAVAQRAAESDTNPPPPPALSRADTCPTVHRKLAMDEVLTSNPVPVFSPVQVHRWRPAQRTKPPKRHTRTGEKC